MGCNFKLVRVASEKVTFEQRLGADRIKFGAEMGVG